MADKTFIVKIKRQQRPDESVRWEEYELRYRPHLNIIQCLRDIAEKPFTRDGTESTPVTYDANCLEEVCGACAMLINGQAAAGVFGAGGPSRKADSLGAADEVSARARSAGGPRQDVRRSEADAAAGFLSTARTIWDRGRAWRRSCRKWAIRLSRCITCGNCLEICPKVNEHTQFVGAAIISQVRLFNLHPTGAMHAGDGWKR